MSGWRCPLTGAYRVPSWASRPSRGSNDPATGQDRSELTRRRGHDQIRTWIPHSCRQLCENVNTFMKRLVAYLPQGALVCSGCDIGKPSSLGWESLLGTKSQSFPQIPFHRSLPNQKRSFLLKRSCWNTHPFVLNIYVAIFLTLFLASKLLWLESHKKRIFYGP